MKFIVLCKPEKMKGSTMRTSNQKLKKYIHQGGTGILGHHCDITKKVGEIAKTRLKMAIGC